MRADSWRGIRSILPIYFPLSNPRGYLRLAARLCSEVGIRRTTTLLLNAIVRIATALLVFQSRHEDHRLVVIGGHDVWVSSSDRGISRELLFFGVHEPILLVLLSSELREGDRVADIGANLGYYTLIESGLIGKRGMVAAIEPDPRTRVLLEYNVSRNGYNNIVRILPYAIGPRKGMSRLSITKAFNVSRITESPQLRALQLSAKAPAGNALLVEMRTLDDLMSEIGLHVTVIRMDLEGYEYKVIEGMLNTLSNSMTRLIVVEMHPVRDFELVLSFLHHLHSRGYKIKWVISRALVDGLLTVPPQVFRETVDCIRKPSTYVKRARFEAPVIEEEGFAREFFESCKTLHVIFERDVRLHAE